ncbi:MAG: c-type cytochrome, partial [Chloroflexota bacterium]
AAAPVEPTTAPTVVVPTTAPTPAPTRSETTKPAPMPVGLVVLGSLTLLAALGLLAAYLPRLSEGARGWSVLAPIIVGVTGIIFTTAALYTLLAGPASRVTTIREEVPYPIIATAEVVVTATSEPGVLFETVEGRVEAWQARIPSDYTGITNPYTLSDTGAVDAGRRLFRDNNCAVCHGTGLQGDGDFSEALNPKPVNLTDKALMNLPFMTDTYLYWRISEGGSQSPFFSAMPAWKQVLSPEERWQLAAFVRSQTAETVSDKDQAAIAVIEKAGCFACHRFANRGGKIGPGWDGLSAAAATRIADLSAEDYIRQSILDPGGFIVPGYEDKAELMPRDFDEKLAPEEIDLIIYLLTEPH